jgi:PAS domain S-box-containing protein
MVRTQAHPPSPTAEEPLVDTAQVRAEAALRRDATLEAVAFAAQRFLEDPDWSRSIGQVLQRLGEATGVSRVYLYENDEAGGDLWTTLRAQWVSPGQRAVVEVGGRLGFRGLDRWTTLLGRGDLMHGPIASFPEQERPTLEAHGIRSIVLAPLAVDGGWWGYIGFDDCVEEREWSQIEIDALRAAAGTLGAAIARERSERRLREAEARYRSIVERTPAVTYQEHPEAAYSSAEAIMYMSPQIERILGYPADRWASVPGFWMQVIHPDDLDRVAREADRTALSGEPYSQEYRMIATDGRVVWFRDESVLIRDERGRPVLWQGVMVDITDRKQVEEQVLATEQRLRELVENIPAMTYREALDGNPEDFYVSPQVVEMFGYSPQEWTWTPNFWADRVHPDDAERIAELDRRANETGLPFSAEYRFRRADGTYVWVADHATLVGESKALWQGFLMDITERKGTEEALARAEERFRLLVEQVPVIIYTQEIDPADPSISRTTYVSPRAEELLGYTVEEAIETGDLWYRTLHPDDRERVAAADAAGNQSGDDFLMEYRMIAKDGRTLWIHDEATVIRDEDGRPRWWQGVMLDVTERRQADERIEHALEVEREAAAQLRALDEMKNTFLQAVSHDLRTPLAAILGLAITLERTELELPPEETQDLANRIATNARKLDRMVTDLLDLDRLARGIVRPKRHPVDVGALVSRVVAESDLIAEGRIELDAAPVTVSVDASKVERIVENLLANTARHTPAGTPVWVRVAPAQQGVVIAVEDQGPGVPAELRETIFEPFRQGPDAPEHSPGVGVGLTLVRRFAELHDGRAWVEERPGGGASFRVFLPDAPASESADDDG